MKENLTIIAVHGAGMNGAVFAPLAAQMQIQGLAFHAVTLPGHDSARSDALLPSIAAMAQWLRGYLADRPAASVILLGHSMGALVALEASDAPAVRAVAVMGAAARMPVNPDLLKTARETPAKAQELVAKWGFDPGRADLAILRPLLLDAMAKTPPAALHNDLAACNGYAGAARCAKPLLVLCGRHDKMTRMEEGVALADANEAGYIILEDCGHMPMLESAAETALRLKQFAEENAGISGP